MTLHCPPAPSHLDVVAQADQAVDGGHRAPSPVADGPLEATRSVEQAWRDLRVLLDRAALLDPTSRADAAEWDLVHEAAVRTTRRLASLGVLRGHLVVSAEDPAVVVRRLLAAASRGPSGLYAASSTGRSAWESNTTADA